MLVVDDLAANLKVAEGLLAPYKGKVDTCSGGLQAIELVKRNNYDIVFMDHMMPGMDGIEAVAHIRAKEKKHIPIIMLTANAVAGMREMFLEKGLDDFLAKPIDITKLDDILVRWMPREKRETSERKSCSPTRENRPPTPQSLIIRGIDVQQGITMTGGTLTGYIQVLTIFCKDAQERLHLLQKMPITSNLTEFTTYVHALKSAMASIGAADLSAEATRLEAAGIAHDITFIQDNLTIFIGHLEKLIKNIRSALQISEEHLTDQNFGKSRQQVQEANFDPAGDISAYIPIFRELAEALKSQKAEDIDHIMEKIHKKPLDAHTKKIVETISDDVLMTEFESAIQTIDTFINTNR
ncbi:MAG: response regulator [Treponema sp.]|nr:response regulator [Treponema sp.]